MPTRSTRNRPQAPAPSAVFVALETPGTQALDSALGRGRGRIEKTDGTHTPLLRATALGRGDLVELLLARGANVHARAKNGGDSALHLVVAAGSERVAIAQQLIAAGIEVDGICRRIQPAFHLACGINDVALMELLHKAGACLDYIHHLQDTTPLMNAANCGCVEAVGYLLAAGADPTLLSREDHRTAARRAADSGFADLAQQLIQAEGLWRANQQAGMLDTQTPRQQGRGAVRRC